MHKIRRVLCVDGGGRDLVWNGGRWGWTFPAYVSFLCVFFLIHTLFFVFVLVASIFVSLARVLLAVHGFRLRKRKKK